MRARGFVRLASLAREKMLIQDRARLELCLLRAHLTFISTIATFVAGELTKAPLPEDRFAELLPAQISARGRVCRWSR